MKKLESLLSYLVSWRAFIGNLRKRRWVHSPRRSYCTVSRSCQGTFGHRNALQGFTALGNLVRFMTHLGFCFATESLKRSGIIIPNCMVPLFGLRQGFQQAHTTVPAEDRIVIPRRMNLFCFFEASHSLVK